MHGSNLIREIHKKNPFIKFHGLGRDRMVEAGMNCIHDMSSRSVMWLHALKKIPELWNIFKDCTRFFDEEKPELVILLDYAGFNFYLAKAAKKKKYSSHVLHKPSTLGSWAMESKKDKETGRQDGGDISF